MLDKHEYKAKQENILLEAGIYFEAAFAQNFAFIIEKLGVKKNSRKQIGRNVVEDEGKRFMELAEVFAKRLERARWEKFTFLLVGRAGANRAKPVNVLLSQDTAIQDTEGGSLELLCLHPAAPSLVYTRHSKDSSGSTPSKEVVPEDEQLHDTFQVTTYEHNEGESKFSIVDTPGLCNIPAEQRKDYTYQTRLEDGAPRFDGLWFVTPLLEAGITDGERYAMKLITQAYGSDAWRYAVILLTYDGVLEQEAAYQKIYQEKKESLRQEIARLVDEEVAAAIPVVPVACDAKTTPDGKEWLSELYVAVSTRMSDQGYLSFLLTTAKRLRFSLPKSPRKAARSIRISASASQNSFSPAKNHENSICIDEEKSRAIKRRMRDYLTNVAKRNRIAFR